MKRMTCWANKLFEYKTILLVGLLILLIIGTMFIPVTSLAVFNGGKLQYAVLPGDKTFSIQWEHSVEKETWVEHFEIKDDRIYLESTKFKTFGAGVPYKSEHPTTLKNGWVHMDVNREIGHELVIRASEMNHYQLIRGNKAYFLKARDTAYTITVEKISVAQVLLTYFKSIVR